MSLTPENVKKIADLAQLNLSKEEITQYTPQLSNILDLIEQMSQVDTNQIQPLAHPLDLAQRGRVDQVVEEDLREKFQRIAPKVQAGLYLVPKVIE
ncbi:MAG TPA: Asp-tRNA(Asn)/Glu-tRNA(Gln) amidotransferase subunit GatC [Gammaproteobacteria bacterium]|jgi:aspartyl-tRNA(Asn)/glutamyl-tRNA(Gln) amidotransferase subunit C|nr:Asp-tRNA(Asn)/Glu-tRNA(Gln) amidotransferase subunit GatC [Gammaproteobacteria bacterium]